MTEKQTRFIKEYMIDLNAKQAAIRAGYSAKTAKEQGYRLLKNSKIRTRVDEELALVLQRITEKNDKYAHELERIAFADVSDFINLTTGELKASPIDISAVATLKAKKIRTKDGEITEYEIKLTGKLKALKKLNKYFERISQLTEATNCSQDTKIEATDCPSSIDIPSKIDSPSDIGIFKSPREPDRFMVKGSEPQKEVEGLRPSQIAISRNASIVKDDFNVLEIRSTHSNKVEIPQDSNIIDIRRFIKPKAVRATVCPRYQNIFDKSEHLGIKNPEEQPYFRCHTYTKSA